MLRNQRSNCLKPASHDALSQLNTATIYLPSGQTKCTLQGRITCHCEEESSLLQSDARLASHCGRKPPLFSSFDSDASAPNNEKNDGQLSCFSSPLNDDAGSQCHSPNAATPECSPPELRSGTEPLKDFGTRASISTPRPAPPCRTTIVLNGDWI